MARALTVEYWSTEDGIFARVPERGICLQAETLDELATLVEACTPLSGGLAFVPGEALPEETLV